MRYNMVDINTFESAKQEPDIEIEQVLGGKITELKIQGSIFVVKPDTKVDPVKAAKDFISAFDIKRTAMIRKIKAEPEKPTISKQLKAVATRNAESGLETVGRENNIPIYKEYIIGLYRKHPTTFDGRNVIDYMSKMYKGAAGATLANKQRAYIKFMIHSGMIEQTGGHGKIGRIYKFREAPYGAELPAQAEYDTKFMDNMKQRELITIRDQ